MPEQSHRNDLIGARCMALFFAIGSTCFVVAPLTGYAAFAGAHGDALTFFIGSILFTLGGATQTSLAWTERADDEYGKAVWRTAWIQSIGTVFFNVMTFLALTTPTSSPNYNMLVWRQDAIGSVCFLISGAIFYAASPRRSWLPQRNHQGWWEPAANFVGCALFGISAVAGYAVSSTGSLVNTALSNWTTTLGAACFLAVAVPTLNVGHTFKVARLQALRLRQLELLVEREFEQVA